jgi:hypothetical protein
MSEGARPGKREKEKEKLEWSDILLRATRLNRKGQPTTDETLLRKAWTAACEADDGHGRGDCAHRLAAYYQDAGRLDDSEVWARRAITEEEAPKGRPVLLANHLMFMGQLLAQRGDVESALDFVERALPLYRTHVGAHHTETAYMLSVAAMLCRRCAREGDADRYDGEAKAILGH